MAQRNKIGKDISALRAQCIRWAKALFLALAVAIAGYFLCNRLKVGPEPEKIVEFVLAVLAICFALYQFTDSDELKETIRYVAANASTRYVNMFPHNMEEVEEVIAGSTKRLRVMVDVVGYGSFSRPEEFYRYTQALRNLRHGSRIVDIELLVFDKNLRHEMLCDQFPIGRWPEIRNEIQKRDDLKKFFEKKWLHPVPDYNNFEYKDFIQKLEANHDHVAEEWRGDGITIIETSKQLPFFLWLQDDRKAVFSFANRGQDPREFSFSTMDGKLIDTFHSIFDELWDATKLI